MDENSSNNSSSNSNKYERVKRLVADEISRTEGVAAFKASSPPLSESDREKLVALLARVKKVETTVEKYKLFVANEKKLLRSIRVLKVDLGTQSEDIHHLNASLPSHMKPQEQLSTSQMFKHTEFRPEKRVSKSKSEALPCKKAKT